MARPRTYVWFFLALAVLSVIAIIVPIVVNLSQQLTPEQLAEAKARWEKNGPADYELTYFERIDSEDVPAYYEARVRKGELVRLSVKEPERGTREINLERLSPERRRSYTVAGLFEQMEEHQESDRRNFATARFDPTLGYPLRYIRRIRGTKSRLEWVNVTVKPLAKE